MTMTSGRKSMVGTVTSNKMDKTVVVAVERLGRHPLYKKVVKSQKKFKAHDAENACRIGDVVRIVESRPLSKEKRWVVEEILRSPAARFEQ
ncbi:MAG TPA: 30S ribosomal protein S17 [Chloroflexi bacterium]|nr:30S ribosomal protein S17 [Chloroflexota bacterium]